MSEKMFRLVYHSRNLIHLDGDELASEIEAILATSRRNNAAAGITGALIFNRGIFAQVLEGPQSAIETTFERIQRDMRHGNVQVLSFEVVTERGFPSWSMAFIGRSREGEEMFGKLGSESGFQDAHLDGQRVFQIMRSIALEEESFLD
jgi:hypothetical protein